MYKLFIISGPSGSGKTTLLNLFKKRLLEINQLTTRPIRSNEVDGNPYTFVTTEILRTLNETGQLACYLQFKRTSYGIYKHEILEKVRCSHSFLITSYDGFCQLKDVFDFGIVSIFLDVSWEDFKLNLMMREGNGEMVQRRIPTYHRERKHMNQYSYILTNRRGHFEDTIKQFDLILQKEIP